MERRMSLRAHRRSMQPNMEEEHEASKNRPTEFNVDNESIPNIKYSSALLKKIDSSRLGRQSGGPSYDSEESTDALKAQTKPLKRRKTSRSSKKELISSAKIITGGTDRRGKKQRRSRRRRSEESKNDRAEDEEDTDFAHRRGERSAELPIVELLRRAQENQKSPQSRYEEPIPLPELTTDTLYVQGKNGFSAVKIGNYKSDKSSSDRLLKPIHIAIKTHTLSKTVMFFCQGLLGGIALSQVILMTKIQADSNLLSQINFTGYPHLMSGLFLFLVTMSLLAAMDRIDIAHLDPGHFREIFSQRCMMIVTCPLYLTAICIHLSASNIDQSVGQVLGRSNVTMDEEYSLHRQTHTWKFVLCILAWLSIALGPGDDLTTAHLEAMQKYAA